VSRAYTTMMSIADCFKEYYTQHNLTFSDSERATIFWQSMLPLSDKLTALRKIMRTTTDAELKSQIQKRISVEEETMTAFMNCDNGYIHTIKLDDSDHISGVFNLINPAVSFGKENCRRIFHIRNELPNDNVASDTNKNFLLYGNAEFKKDGTMIDCECHFSDDPSFTLLNAIEPSGFEEAYIPVLNPFEYGDIVHIMGDTCPAVVMVSREHWNESRERQKSSNYPQNYYSNTMTVEFLYPDGTFSHGHPDILSLEKIEHWDDEDEWNLLKSVSRLMKGHGCIEELFENYRVNKFHKE